MSAYRTGNHHGVTIVRETPIDGMTAVDAQLVAVVVNGDQALAERICALLNAPPPKCPACRHTVGNHIASGCVVLVEPLNLRCPCRPAAQP